MNPALAFLLLARPHFLLGGALLYFVGLASVDAVDPARAWVALAMVLSIQLTAHFSNEYFDEAFDHGVINRTMFSGGSGVLVAGHLPPLVAVGAAMATSLVAVILGIFVASWSVGASVVGLVALVVAWLYSTPPIRLTGTGWGELVVTFVVTMLVPLTAVLAQRAPVAGNLVGATVVLFFIHLAMILVFELPDRESDETAGKRVVAVRVGEANTITLLLALYVVATGAAIGLAIVDRPPGAAWIAVGAAPGMAAVGLLARTDRYILLTTFAVLALTGGAVAALVVLART